MYNNNTDTENATKLQCMKLEKYYTTFCRQTDAEAFKYISNMYNLQSRLNLLEVDRVEHIPHFLPAEDGLETLVLDISQERVLPLSLLLAVKILH